MRSTRSADDRAAVRTPDPATLAQLRDKVRMVAADRAAFGVLSTGEKCAVALVLDDRDMMAWWGTALDCADRIDGDWLIAAVWLQRNGWEDE